ncbi:MAG TPA: hypothetical protein VFE50_25855 [Cyclobacteriaceae bacterium]|nr:hypothetical protein [Cyclobacteriaceae bacterium]
MDKEKWKDDVLNSLQGIKRAEPNPFLFTRIEAVVSRVREVTPNQWRVVIAVGLILLFINGWTLLSDRQQAEPSSPYQLNNHNYQLY